MIVASHFGGCPTCGSNDSYLNVLADHYCVCNTHRVFWPIGSNVFADWRSESDEIWRANRAKIRTYKRVMPLPMGARVTSPANVVYIHDWQARRPAA